MGLRLHGSTDHEFMGGERDEERGGERVGRESGIGGGMGN